jgi:hypothetical protein
MLNPWNAARAQSSTTSKVAMTVSHYFDEAFRMAEPQGGLGYALPRAWVKHIKVKAALYAALAHYHDGSYLPECGLPIGQRVARLKLSKRLMNVALSTARGDVKSKNLVAWVKVSFFERDFIFLFLVKAHLENIVLTLLKS